MTREEAIKRIDILKSRCERLGKKGLREWEMDAEACDLALSVLRSVSREQVERMRGEWIFKPFYKGTSRGAIECQECKGAFEGSVEFNFCPNCGAPMTDEAVEMVMERLEALYDNRT